MLNKVEKLGGSLPKYEKQVDRSQSAMLIVSKSRSEKGLHIPDGIHPQPHQPDFPHVSNRISKLEDHDGSLNPMGHGSQAQSTFS